MPLPNPEITPPSTKIYFTGVLVANFNFLNSFLNHPSYQFPYLPFQLRLL